MGLIADDQVPVSLFEFLLDILIATELVESADGQRVLKKPVPCPRGFKLVVRHDLERQMKPAVQFVLPLLGEIARTDDEAMLQVAAGDQLLHEQPGHDRLAGTWVIGKKEPQWLARQHLTIYGRDLVRERIDKRSVNRQKRVEEIRESNAIGLGDKAEHGPVAVEAPRPAFDGDF